MLRCFGNGGGSLVGLGGGDRVRVFGTGGRYVSTGEVGCIMLDGNRGCIGSGGGDDYRGVCGVGIGEEEDDDDPIPCSCQGIRVLFTLDTLDSWCPHLQQQSFVSQLELVQGHNQYLPHHRCHQQDHSEDSIFNSFYAKEELDPI